MPAFCALLLLAAEFAGVLAPRAPSTPRWPAWWWVAGLFITYALQLAIVVYAAHHQFPVRPWLASMPLAVVDDRGFAMAHADAVTAAMLTLAALQSYALLALYRSASVAPALRWGGCTAMLALSLAAPSLISFDLYGYVHDAMLGLAAYDPPHVPFGGEYHVFDLWFGRFSKTIYGPLWIVLVRLVTTAAPTLLTKLIAWRVFCAMLYLALIAGLRALRVPPRVLTIVALNPGMMLQFVSNGHNDLVAIVLLVFAAALVRRHPAVATALVAVAGLVKLPYAVLGIPVLAALRGVPARVVAASLALVAVAVLSYAGGGAPYFHALTAHAESRFEPVAQHAGRVAALLLIGATLVVARRMQTGIWSMPLLGAYSFSWYYAWGFPYALARRRILAYLLVAFPFVAMLTESAFARPWEPLVVLPLATILSLRAFSFSAAVREPRPV